MKIDGGCHCGAMAYEAEIDPEKVGICHCTDCQMLTGSPYRVSVPAPSATFKWLRGEPSIYVKTTAGSGTKRKHAFCGHCGSPIYASAMTDTPFYTLRVGSIRQRAELAPKRQIWCRSALPWAMDIEELPKSEQS
jgi:hypothetical protein